MGDLGPDLQDDENKNLMLKRESFVLFDFELWIISVSWSDIFTNEYQDVR